MDPGSLSWLLTSAALVLFMTPGLAFFYGGMDRSKNVLNMLMMNFWCLLTIPVLWAVVGFSLAQVPFENDLIGNFDNAFLRGLSITPWGGVFGPANMPRPIVDRVSRELAVVLQQPAVREAFQKLAFEPFTSLLIKFYSASSAFRPPRLCVKPRT